MNLPKPITLRYDELIKDIENGKIKIPQFQREFVWDKMSTAKLLDSIIKGYPIGTFIFWSTLERLRMVGELGKHIFKEPQSHEEVNYVLDGQQRITSLFIGLKGAKVGKENYADIYVDLLAEEDEEIVVLDVSSKDEGTYIRFTDLLEKGVMYFVKNFDEALIEKIDLYQKKINNYDFSIIQTKNVSIDVATDIFTRINVGGKSLSVFEIMAAKTYDHESGFDLAERYKILSEELEEIGYGTVPDITLLQLISTLVKKQCSKKVILQLKKKEVIDIFDKAVDCMKEAIDYFRTFYRIPVSRLLPYNALIIPFAYYFYKTGSRPNGKSEKLMQDFFWRCSLSERYSSSTETKLSQDIIKIDTILEKCEKPKYDWSIQLTEQSIIDNGWFSAGRSYIKAILALYASKAPKSFDNGADIIIDNAYLKQANSKNYHHFFPRAFLTKQGEDNFNINHILNITIVDDFLNKRKIGAKAPSKYMQKFKSQNSELNETMKSHLIPDLDKMGIWEDDYDKFFEERAVVVYNELKSRMVD